MSGWGQQPEALSQAGRSDLSSRSGQALDALGVAAEAHGGYDRIPGNSPDLQFAYDTAMGNNRAIRGLATDGEAGFGFADPFTIAGTGDSWKGHVQSALRQGARDLAISGGVVTGMLQGVGDSVIGAGVLVKDLLLAQQYMFGGGDNAVNRFWPGFDARQDAYQNVRALGATVSEIVSDPQRYLGDMVGRSVDKVTNALSTANKTDDLNDWFFYGAEMGKVTFGVASTVAGAVGAARLATAGAGELNLLLRSRIDALAPDVRAIPFAAELSRGSPVRALPENWQGPSLSKGRWVGEKGNSDFALNNASAKTLDLPEGTSIRFADGVPDFGPHTVNTPAGTPGSFGVKGLVYEHAADGRTTIKHLAQEANMTPLEVKKWLAQQDVRMHHFNGNTMQLVPTKLHTWIHHTGSRALWK